MEVGIMLRMKDNIKYKKNVLFFYMCFCWFIFFFLICLKILCCIVGRVIDIILRMEFFCFFNILSEKILNELDFFLVCYCIFIIIVFCVNFKVFFGIKFCGYWVYLKKF